MRYLVIFLVIAVAGHYAFGLGYDGECCTCVSKKLSRDENRDREVHNRELEGYSSLSGAVGAVWVQNKEYFECRTGFRVPTQALHHCRLNEPHPVCTRL